MIHFDCLLALSIYLQTQDTVGKISPPQYNPSDHSILDRQATALRSPFWDWLYMAEGPSLQDWRSHCHRNWSWSAGSTVSGQERGLWDLNPSSRSAQTAVFAEFQIKIIILIEVIHFVVTSHKIPVWWHCYLLIIHHLKKRKAQSLRHFISEQISVFNSKFQASQGYTVKPSLKTDILWLRTEDFSICILDTQEKRGGLF